MVFHNGMDGTPSQIQSITIDKDKPKKPNVIKPSSPTSIKSFNFKNKGKIEIQQKVI